MRQEYVARTPFLVDNGFRPSELLPADVLVFAVQDETQHPVRLFQSQFAYSDEAKRSIHAALYIGFGSLVHAIGPRLSDFSFGGVEIDSAKRQFQESGRRIYVLRDYDLSDIERAYIALSAASHAHSHSTYDYRSIVGCLLYQFRRAAETSSVFGPYAEAVTKWFFDERPRSVRLGEPRSAEHLSHRPLGKIDRVPLEKASPIEQAIISQKGGVASFICSDLVLSAFESVVADRNKLTSVPPKAPIFCPADIFDNAGLKCLRTTMSA